MTLIEKLAAEKEEHSVVRQTWKPSRVFIPHAELEHAAEAMRLIREMPFEASWPNYCHGVEWHDLVENWQDRDCEMRE